MLESIDGPTPKGLQVGVLCYPGYVNAITRSRLFVANPEGVAARVVVTKDFTLLLFII
jgi:hypothetical protein